MTDKKQNQKPVTLEDIQGLLAEFRVENKVQYEAVIHRMESILTRRPGVLKVQKKQVDKKTNAKKDDIKGGPVHYSNTMHWWVAMYALGNDAVSSHFTDTDVVSAKDSIVRISGKPLALQPNGNTTYDTKRAVGLTIWKTFPKAKKQGALKTMFENWKKESAQQNTENVDTEEHTDVEHDAQVPVLEDDTNV